jgi:hypothetical protein
VEIVVATQTPSRPQSAPLLQGAVLVLFYTGMATMSVFLLEWGVRYLQTGKDLPITLEIPEVFWQYIAFFCGCALWTLYSLYMSRPAMRAAIQRRLDPGADVEVASMLLALVFGITSVLFLAMAAAHAVLLVTGGVLTHAFFRRCVHGQAF